MAEDFFPSVLVDIIGVSTYSYGTHDYYDSSAAIRYKAGLIEYPQLTEQLGDIWNGVEEQSRVTLRFDAIDNTIDSTWAEIVAAEDIRGLPVKIQRLDRVTGVADALVFQMRGKVVDWELGKTEMRVDVEMRDDEILETLLPKGVVTTAFDVTALDVGAPINICFGYCKDVPCPNIQNDTANDQYDYLIGYGVIEGVWADAANGRGVKRDGVLVNTSEYTAYDGSQANPYNGYAFIRFVHEQRHHNGQMHQVTADVKGLELGGASANRDFSDAIEALLTNATYGLGDSVDSTSFGDAATALAAIGDLYCDGAITEQRRARDIISDLLFSARASMQRGADGEWEITIDAAAASALTLGDNDGFYNNCSVVRRWCAPSTESIKELILHYDLRRYNDREQPYLEIKETVRSAFGVDRLYELPFVSEGDTALKIAGYLKGRETYSNEYVEVLTDLEGKNLGRGDVITLTCATLGISAQTYKVCRATRDNKTEYRLEAWKYHADIYTTAAVATAPTAQTLPNDTTTGPQAFVPTWEEKSANFDAHINHYYAADTSGGAITGTLDASPANGDMVNFENDGDSWETNHFTIDGNGTNIEWNGSTYDGIECDMNGVSVVLKYNSTAGVWKVM